MNLNRNTSVPENHGTNWHTRLRSTFAVLLIFILVFTTAMPTLALGTGLTTEKKTTNISATESTENLDVESSAAQEADDDSADEISAHSVAIISEPTKIEDDSPASQPEETIDTPAAEDAASDVEIEETQSVQSGDAAGTYETKGDADDQTSEDAKANGEAASDDANGTAQADDPADADQDTADKDADQDADADDPADTDTTADDDSEEPALYTPAKISKAARTALKETDLTSLRLIIGVDEDHEFIFENDPAVLSAHDGLYLLQFETEEDAADAFLRYYDAAEFVAPDQAVEIAGPADQNSEEDPAEDPIYTETVFTETENPIAELSAAIEAAEESGIDAPAKNVRRIALIDTGAETNKKGQPKSQNVIDLISMIGDDPADDNGHGTQMIDYITEENPDAEIISIKALGKDGIGDISAVIAAIHYAIERDVEIINLSLSAYATEENAALSDAIEKAASAGIIVVGAAGNQGYNAKYYIPGSIDAALIVGAADSNGTKIEKSNFGDTVDYNVVSASTSEAAARMSGILSVSGTEGLRTIKNILNQGLIFTPDYEPAEEDDIKGEEFEGVQAQSITLSSGPDDAVSQKTWVANSESSSAKKLGDQGADLGTSTPSVDTWTALKNQIENASNYDSDGKMTITVRENLAAYSTIKIPNGKTVEIVGADGKDVTIYRDADADSTMGPFFMVDEGTQLDLKDITLSGLLADTKVWVTETGKTWTVANAGLNENASTALQHAASSQTKYLIGTYESYWATPLNTMAPTALSTSDWDSKNPIVSITKMSKDTVLNSDGTIHPGAYWHVEEILHGSEAGSSKKGTHKGYKLVNDAGYTLAIHTDGTVEGAANVLVVGTDNDANTTAGVVKVKTKVGASSYAIQEDTNFRTWLEYEQNGSDQWGPIAYLQQAAATVTMNINGDLEQKNTGNGVYFYLPSASGGSGESELKWSITPRTEEDSVLGTGDYNTGTYGAQGYFINVRGTLNADNVTFEDARADATYDKMAPIAVPIAANATITNSTIKNNSFAGTNSAGGIRVDSGTVALTNTAIHENTGGKAGAVVANGGTTTITGSTLYDNAGNGTATSATTISVSGGTVNMQSGTIGKDETTESDISPIRVTNGTFSMSGGTIKNHTVSGSSNSTGGVIDQSGGTVNISGGSITGNTGTKAGVIYQTAGVATISGGTISSNTGTDTDGAGVANIASGTLNVNANANLNNNTGVASGAITASGGTTNINGGNINNNTGTGDNSAGAIHASGSAKVNTGLSGSTKANINNNTGKKSGAIYVGSGATVDVNGGTNLNNNTASTNDNNAGAVYVDGGTFNITGGQTKAQDTAADQQPAGGSNYRVDLGNNNGNATIYVNSGTATQKGGDIYSNNAKGTNPAPVKVMSNGTYNMEDGGIIDNDKGNTSQVAGGVYVDGGKFNMSGGAIGSATNGRCSYGSEAGGIYAVNGAEVNMSGGTIRYGRSQNVGAIHAKDATTKVTISGDAIITKSKVASENAACAVLVENGATLNMTGGTIKDHNKNTDGCNWEQKKNSAPVIVDNANINISGGHITGNTVGYDSSKNPESYQDAHQIETLVEKNTTPTNSAGGLIVKGANAKATISSDGSIDQNDGDIGAVLLTDHATLTMTGGQISQNVGFHYSGGVQVEDGATFIMNDGTISKNVTWSKGGAVWATEWGTVKQPNKNWWARTITWDGDKPDGGTFVMNGGSLDGNYAFLRGGAINVESNNVTLNGGEIKNNWCRVLGGGIYVEGDFPNYSYTLYMENGYIGENSAYKNLTNTENNATLNKYLSGRDSDGNPIHDGSSVATRATGDESAFPGMYMGNGGGVWLCPIGGTSIFSIGTIGGTTYNVVLDENYADGGNANRKGTDFFLERGTGSITVYQIGDTWVTDPGGKKLNFDEATVVNGAFGMLNTGTTKTDDYSGSGVKIYNNISRDGGGIAANGTLLFGSLRNIYRMESNVKVVKSWPVQSKINPEAVTFYAYYKDDAYDSTKTLAENITAGHAHPITAIAGSNTTENKGEEQQLEFTMVGKENSDGQSNENDIEGELQKIDVRTWQYLLSLPLSVTKTTGVNGEVETDAQGNVVRYPLYTLIDPNTNKEYFPTNAKHIEYIYNLIAYGVEEPAENATRTGTEKIFKIGQWNLALQEKALEGVNFIEGQAPTEVTLKAEDPRVTTIHDGGGETVKTFSVNFSTATMEQSFYNDVEPTVEKYVNKKVHEFISFDEIFEYDIMAYVPLNAEQIKIEDTLPEILEFVDTDKVTLQVLQGTTANDSKADNNGTVTTGTYSGIGIYGACASRLSVNTTTGKITVSLDKTKSLDEGLFTGSDFGTAGSETSIRGRWLKLTFKARLKEAYRSEDALQTYLTAHPDDGTWEEVKDQNSYKGDYPNYDYGNASTYSDDIVGGVITTAYNASTPHTGIANNAKYTVNNSGEYTSNTVTVRPEEPQIEKYVNKRVHQDVQIDDYFRYDIMTYVPNGAKTVEITDTLPDELAFVDLTNGKIWGEEGFNGNNVILNNFGTVPADKKYISDVGDNGAYKSGLAVYTTNNHHGDGTGTVKNGSPTAAWELDKIAQSTTAIADSDYPGYTLKGYNDQGFVGVNGQNLVLKLTESKTNDVKGKWIRISFVVKIKDSSKAAIANKIANGQESTIGSGNTWKDDDGNVATGKTATWQVISSNSSAVSGSIQANDPIEEPTVVETTVGYNTHRGLSNQASCKVTFRGGTTTELDSNIVTVKPTLVGLNLEKYGKTGTDAEAPLSDDNLQFEIYRMGHEDEALQATKDSTDKYKFSWTNSLLPNEVYIIKEVNTPSGYDGVSNFKVKVDKNGNATLVDHDEENHATVSLSTDKKTVKVINLAQTSGIKIKKVDEDGAHLSDATFTIYTAAEYDAGNLDSLGGTIAGGVTRAPSEGATEVFEWKGLTAGDYVIVESEPPEGYVDRIGALRFHLDTDGTVTGISEVPGVLKIEEDDVTGGGKSVTITLTNHKKFDMAIGLKKVNSEDHTQLLDDAEFTLTPLKYRHFVEIASYRTGAIKLDGTEIKLTAGGDLSVNGDTPINARMVGGTNSYGTWNSDNNGLPATELKDALWVVLTNADSKDAMTGDAYYLGIENGQLVYKTGTEAGYTPRYGQKGWGNTSAYEWNVTKKNGVYYLQNTSAGGTKYLKITDDGKLTIAGIEIGDSTLDTTNAKDLNATNYHEDTGTWSVTGITQEGFYKLTETKVPDGYMHPGHDWYIKTFWTNDSDGKRVGSFQVYTPQEITTGITNATLERQDVIKVDGKYYKLTEVNNYDVVNGVNKYDKITNTPLYELPNSGGIGTYWHTIIGTMFLALAAVFIHRMTKSRVRQDA